MISTVTTKPSGDKSYQSLVNDNSTNERVIASTVSVDKYFDEFIYWVRKHYADLLNNLKIFVDFVI